jgi:hypothetical protein
VATEGTENVIRGRQLSFSAGGTGMPCCYLNFLPKTFSAQSNSLAAAAQKYAGFAGISVSV